MKRTEWMLCLIVALMITVAFVPGVAHAYVGPGAGLGMIGSLIAVVGAILVALLGLVMFPISLLRKRRRQRAASESATPATPPAEEG